LVKDRDVSARISNTMGQAQKSNAPCSWQDYRALY
jgi:hypothetical protein